MNFQHCTIVGIGLLGGSLALDLRRHYPEIIITGIARRQATLDEASLIRHGKELVFNRLSLNLEDAADADLVVLCTPVQTIIQQLAALAKLLKPGAVVTDVGSAKRAVMNAAVTVLPPTVHFIGGHPMAGSDRAGLIFAVPDLFVDASWALCIPPGHEEAAAKLAEVIQTLGAHPVIIDAASHDAIVALTSHLPHVVAAALVKIVLSHEEVMPFLAGGFRDTTRIAAGNPPMWRDIILTNRDQVISALNLMIAELTTWRDVVRSGDAPHLEALLTTACDQREQLNK
jgi:prephenate dehydrogenase